MFDFKEIEENARERWRKQNLLEQLQNKNKGGKKYFLLDGPPYANNVPHVGNIRNTMGKDVMIRFKFMQGHDVFFQPGFDTHGLPVENMVEKECDLHSKKDIVKMGVDNFTKRCKELAAQRKDEWLQVYEKMGSWYSWKEPYLSYNNDYIAAGWWAFSKMEKKGLVYEGKKPVFWCPHCETALSGYEVTDSYKVVSDPAIYVKFPVKGKPNTFLLVYTTTPWTLVSHVAIAVHPDELYILAHTAHGKLILAKPRLKILEELGIGYAIEEEMVGKSLEGLQYEAPLDVPTQKELCKNPKAHKVILSVPLLKVRIASKSVLKGATQKEEFGHFVTMDEGTGLVHTAPGHGKTDNEMGEYYGLPAPSPLTDECKYTDDAGEFSGMFVKEADKDIIAKLESTGKLLFVGKVEHKYPLCWRCKSPLIFRMSLQWFVAIGPLKAKMLKANTKVKWFPAFAQERFHNWVMEAEDWNISRQRYWGIPIPIWKCSSCGEKKIIGSREELQQHSHKDSPPIPEDLHHASSVLLTCACGHAMQRVHDVFDVWFDSGIAPWAFLGYPHKNKELFEHMYPTDRINEAQDQIRGWFYYLMFCGMAVFGKVPYKTISMPGWVVDEKGEKMSKSLGNVIYVKDALEEFGGDILRFYLFSDIAPYSLMKFNKETAKKDTGKIMAILWNLHILAGKEKISLPKKLSATEDKWLLSRMNSTIAAFTEHLEAFEFSIAGKALASFLVEDVSRWYVQLVRERLEKGDTIPLALIQKAVLVSCTLLAPVSPHLADEIYENREGMSVHLQSWPKAGKTDAQLEEDMRLVQEVIAPVLACREKIQLGLRWPLQELVIEAPHEEVLNKYDAIIKMQTNCKTCVFTQSFSRATKSVSIDGKKITDDFGKSAPALLKQLYTLDKNTLAHRVFSEGKVTLLVDSKEFIIQKGLHLHPEYTVPLPYIALGFEQGAVYINTQRTSELDAEGYARESMRRLQQLRKEMGLQKKDVISCALVCGKELLQLLQQQQQQIMEKVGARECLLLGTPPQEKYTHSALEKIKGKEITFYARQTQ